MPADFESLYSRLNDAQKQAVDTIDGPVMVIAGPGTGKTQILAARILNILHLTDTRPEEILCLTYTESGAHNMRQRLTAFMGTDAYKVNIHTFHGLCNKIIQDNQEKFSQRELRVIEDIEKVDILNALIRDLPANSPIKNYQDDPGALRRQLATLFELMQDEGYSASDIGNWVNTLKQEEHFKAAFPEMVYKRPYKEFKAGDIKKSDYDKLCTAWDKLIYAAAEYDNYKAKKASLGVYEFRDMIEWVSTGFDADSDLLLSCQEQYQYVLVDEYQDTSGLQNHILMQLISYWEENPNCFVVGDDDQSIYAFQGARVDNMLSFADKYSSSIKTIVLIGNYRSPQILLDSAKQLIENNQERLVKKLAGLSKDLEAVGENAGFTTPVTVKAFKNRFSEAIWLANTLETNQRKGVAWNANAIIYSKHKLAEDLVSVLKSRSIPFVLARDVDVFQEPLIRELLQWLQYLSEELEFPHKGEHLLYEILHSPLYNISPYEIAKISSDIYNKSTEENKVHWRDYFSDILKKPTQASLFDQSTVSEAVQLVWKETEVWLKEASMFSVPQLIESIYSRGGFLAYALKSEEREWCLDVLNTFLKYAVSRNERAPFLPLKKFLEETETMLANNIGLPLEKRIGSDDGVVLTTAHRSKGLEYQNVYIISADQDSWEKDRSFGLPFKIAALIQGMSMKRSNQQGAEEGFEERRRLFYVAMTRARETLTITYSNQKIDAKGSQLTPSRFVVEITGGAEVEETPIPKDQVAAVSENILMHTGIPKLEGIQESWLRKRIEGFKFAPTTLYSLFECGLKFYFQRIARVPSAPNAAAAYGSAMHNALAKWVKAGTDSTQPKWWNAEELVHSFENELFRQRSSFSEESYKNRLQQGRNLVPEYHRARIDIFRKEKVVITEKWFQAAIEGVEIGGYTDKLVFNGNDVTIVDYKSGNAANAEKKFKAPTERSLAEGKLPPAYWFQVGIYHLVINGISGKNWRAAMGVLDMLDKNEAGEFSQLKMTYSQGDLDLLKGYVVEGKRRLENLEFMQGCNHCEWCAFAKQTGQVIWIPQDEDAP